MSIEVKELNIKASVDTEESSGGGSPNSAKDLQKLKQQILEDVQDMLEEMLEKKGIR
jgi:hypothetical protein